MALTLPRSRPAWPAGLAACRPASFPGPQGASMTRPAPTQTQAQALTFTLSTAEGGTAGVSVTVTDRGAGHPFLLLHGGGGPQTVTGFADLLASTRHARVITPTHPGFGGTIRPATLASVSGLAALYTALLEEMDLADVTVVGNSMGGWIAAEMALLGSPRVTSVILVDAAGIEVPGHPVADVFSLSPDQVSRLSFHDPARFRIDPATLPPAVQAALPGNRASLAVYAGTTSTDPSLAGRLAGVAVPALVLWGEDDLIVDPGYGRAFAAAIPGAQFRLLLAAGHLPQIETPQQALEAIWDFAHAHVRRHAPRGGRPSSGRPGPAQSIWSTEYATRADVAPEAIWAVLRAWYTGTAPAPGGDRFELHGPFAVGSVLSVTPQGQGTLESTIVELAENQAFGNETSFSGLTLFSRYTLRPLAGGGAQVTRSLAISGPRAAEAGPDLGPKISGDFPAEMDELIAAARKDGA